VVSAASDHQKIALASERAVPEHKNLNGEGFHNDANAKSWLTSFLPRPDSSTGPRTQSRVTREYIDEITVRTSTRFGSMVPLRESC
jgi:hypothetical protein